MSELPKSIDRLDTLLLFIVGASFAVPTIAGVYGLDVRVVWVAVVCYAIWIIVKTFLPGIFLSYRERVIIDKMRGWSYVIYLGITFLGNYIMLAILPRTIDVFFTGIFVIGLILSLVLAFLPRKLFRKEIVYMNRKQEKEIHKILKETGSASIYLSISILTLTIELMGLGEFSIANVTLILVVAFGLFVYAIYREKRSSNLTRDLAISLINSGWYNRYSRKSKS